LDALTPDVCRLTNVNDLTYQYNEFSNLFVVEYAETSIEYI